MTGIGKYLRIGLSAVKELRFKAYKSYKGKKQFSIGFQQNVALIIGRNNSGKSSLIDVIEEMIKGARITEDIRTHILFPKEIEGISPIVELNFQIIKDLCLDVYNCLPSSQLVKNYTGKKFAIELTDEGYRKSNKQEDINISLGNELNSCWEHLVRATKEGLKDVTILRLNADRDIRPEIEGKSNDIDKSGFGATNIIRRYVNLEEFDETIVEKNILDELNKIMDRDAHFDAIRVQQIKNKDSDENLWEVFLEENGNKYALSKTGSGLKTILLVLLYLFLVPKTKEYKGKEIIYAFEEIENNLHPALQRKVFEYLYNYSITNNVKMFITTHSHIAINMLYGKEKAKLYHVQKRDGESYISGIETSIECGHILEDIDVKASDLFQTNGIIWVEGPSDRLYILKWLEVFTDNVYKEGIHFQFMYYGGRLLAHYEAADFDAKTDGLINILTTNRHAAIVIDSDKTNKNARINETKKRIKIEFEKLDSFCWITKGKEIENYVSVEAVNKNYGSNLNQIEQYGKFPEYIYKYDKSFSNNKVDAARKMSEFITRENSEKIMDLKDRINNLYNIINGWN